MIPALAAVIVGTALFVGAVLWDRRRFAKRMRELKANLDRRTS